jgi:SAM-dependent methyltransferase
LILRRSLIRAADELLSTTKTGTIASSIYEYRVENGRTYHSFHDGAYWGPNDEQANEHLDLAHALFTKTFGGKLFLAPIPPTTSSVLDLGTGTGIWAIDFADEYPAASVIGTDLSPIQPAWIPPNCKFEIDDMESDWTFEANKFDFIHLRSLQGSIKDWPRLYRQCMRALKPGGYLEEAEYSAQFDTEDNSVAPDSPIADWNRLGPEVHAKLNRELQIFSSMARHFRNAGFVDVEEHLFKWPLGPWPKDKKLKEIGIWARAHVDLGLENWTLRLLTSVLGWSSEKVLLLCAGVREQLNTPGVHAIHRMNVAFGRKPEL